jgi:truncated hemoglobin YjbI
MMEDNTLLQEIGGRPVLEKVHKLFYDKLYEHPWLKIFFLHIDQKVIENQQTDFMVSNMGGGKIYSGGMPRNVHRHMYITEELFDLRTEILKESILACGVPGALAERWVRIDGAFKHSLVKKSIDDCEKRFFTDEILSFPKPS